MRYAAPIVCLALVGCGSPVEPSSAPPAAPSAELVARQERDRAAELYNERWTTLVSDCYGENSATEYFAPGVAKELLRQCEIDATRKLGPSPLLDARATASWVGAMAAANGAAVTADEAPVTVEVEAQAVQDIAVGTPERKALLDSLRPEVQEAYNTPVVFLVRELRSDGSNAWGLLVPQTPDGHALTPAGGEIKVLWDRYKGGWGMPQWTTGGAHDYEPYCGRLPREHVSFCS